ncbi:MAG: molybdenum cofactor guanylyltransferase MobA [Burkholderiaceae bacterium]
MPHTTPPLPRITGLILAGGRGTRMGGVDKGLQLFRNAPMVTHVMQRLAPQVDSIMINANQNISVYQQFGVPVYSDHTPDYAGPLAGLQSGLMHCATEYLVTVPCDSPFLPSDLVKRLYDALQSKNADLAIVVTDESNHRQQHPVFCLLKKSLLAHLSAYLENGGRKVGDWTSSLQCAEVHFADEAAFNNINTLEDLRKFEHE